MAHPAVPPVTQIQPRAPSNPSIQPANPSALQIPGMYFHSNLSLDWASANGTPSSLMTSLFSGKSNTRDRGYSNDTKPLYEGKL